MDVPPTAFDVVLPGKGVPFAVHDTSTSPASHKADDIRGLVLPVAKEFAPSPGLNENSKVVLCVVNLRV